LVTPTHFLPDILPALEPKLSVPVVYNCGGYERVETLRALEGRVDVWLPDMKYSDSGLARALSAAPDYVEVAKAAILEMYRQTGPCVVEGGLLKRGVLIRHLILPGQVDNSIGVLEWIAKTFPKDAVLVSLMSQYVPMGPAAKVPPFDRRITREEYDTVLSWMYLLGLDAGFLQGPEAASLEYVPEFDGTGILKRSKAPNEG
jgi:putative pyruvate formate lyase activating enzyme